MTFARISLFLLGIFALTTGTIGQDPKKTEPKKEEPKLKGYLPNGWRDLGLSDTQKQQVYRIQAKYAEEIDKLEAQIKELKSKMGKERIEVLTPEQKKRLEDYYKGKAGGDK